MFAGDPNGAVLHGVVIAAAATCFSPSAILPVSSASSLSREATAADLIPNQVLDVNMSVQQGSASLGAGGRRIYHAAACCLLVLLLLCPLCQLVYLQAVYLFRSYLSLHPMLSLH